MGARPKIPTLSLCAETTFRDIKGEEGLEGGGLDGGRQEGEGEEGEDRRQQEEGLGCVISEGTAAALSGPEESLTYHF